MFGYEENYATVSEAETSQADNITKHRRLSHLANVCLPTYKGWQSDKLMFIHYLHNRYLRRALHRAYPEPDIEQSPEVRTVDK